MELEKKLSEQSKVLGVSTSKLRAVYLRGVTDCSENGYTEEPMIHGLARVQRFAFALQANNPRFSLDSDLLPKTSMSVQEDTISYEVGSGWPLVFDVMTNESELTKSIFPEGSITETVYDIDSRELSISGTIEGRVWSCLIDTDGGTYTLNIP